MTLEEQAEIKYPMPPRACPWNKKRVLWLREKWIKEQHAETKDNSSGDL